ncbi:MAG: hypothetical protein U9O96_05095 [Candidatus Thermoplasmatota archaeon]|nr:hypothetical protein [Candidatus Thermoplasmatota archaeon]
MNEKIVLIVDDESMIHELLGINLQKMKTPVEIHNALTGEEAIEIYKTLLDKGKRPDLVVMDLNLCGSDELEDFDSDAEIEKGGECDGAVITEEILKMDPKAVVWGYTAWSDMPWAERLKEVGAKKVVDRIVPFKEFAEMVDKFLQE